MKIKNITTWIKEHPLRTANAFGASVLTSGLLLLIPQSPWSLVVIGVFIMFFATVIAFDP